MVRVLVSALFFLISPICVAEEITEALVLDLLSKEKQYMQKKDIRGFSSLLIDGFQSEFKDKTIDKEESVANVIRIFMTSSKILYTPQLLSMKASENRQSAEIQLRIIEKYLYEIGESRSVDSHSNISSATVVVEQGVVKYKSSKYLRSE